MRRAVVPTKFNKTGKRVLIAPLHDGKVSLPAYQRYRRAHELADDEWRRAQDSASRAYVETMADSIAEHVASDSAPAEERYRVVKSLATQLLRPINPAGRSGPERWSKQLGIGTLVQTEDEAWETYVNVCHEANATRQTAHLDTSLECNDMKRALWLEITDYLLDQ